MQERDSEKRKGPAEPQDGTDEFTLFWAGDFTSPPARRRAVRSRRKISSTASTAAFPPLGCSKKCVQEEGRENTPSACERRARIQ